MPLWPLLLIAAEAPATFPERVPGMIEACIRGAIEEEAVTDEDGSHKYICTGAPARTLWAWLEREKIASWEQDTPTDGRWLSRAFPLGGCFKRVRNADGSPPTNGLSCTIWIPHPRA